MPEDPSQSGNGLSGGSGGSNQQSQGSPGLQTQTTQTTQTAQTTQSTVGNNNATTGQDLPNSNPNAEPWSQVGLGRALPAEPTDPAARLSLSDDEKEKAEEDKGKKPDTKNTKRRLHSYHEPGDRV